MAIEERIIRFPELTQMLGRGRSTIYAMIAEGTFPQPIQLGSASAVGFRLSEILDWIDKQPRAEIGQRHKGQ